MISYKYPIFPNKITLWKLAENLDACRWLYNNLLEKMNDAREKDIQLKTYDTQNMIPTLKLENPKLKQVYSKVLQMVNYTLWSNIMGLAESKKNGRKVGHIRFKGSGWYNTLNYNESCFKIYLDHGLLHLSKIGDMRIKLYRKIEGCIKAVIMMEQPAAPIESKPLHHISVMQVLAMKWEAAPFRTR
jgi:putative transposase